MQHVLIHQIEQTENMAPCWLASPQQELCSKQLTDKYYTKMWMAQVLLKLNHRTTTANLCYTKSLAVAKKADRTAYVQSSASHPTSNQEEKVISQRW